MVMTTAYAPIPALQALLHCKTPRRTAITVLADKEEIGSVGNTGLDSQFLSYFVEDLAEAEGLKARHVLSNSQCLSADVTALLIQTMRRLMICRTPA